MANPLPVLRFLRNAAAHSERGALVALAAIEGGAARSVGTLMGVSAGGDWIGSLSGGCVEAALVGEAQRVMDAGRAEVLRIGAGSPLIDIRLPCGSAMDLLLLPDPDPSAVAEACALVEARRPALLELGRDGSASAREAGPEESTRWTEAGLALRIDPELRLVVAGHGEETMALAAQAKAWGAQVLVLSPDERVIAACAPHGEAVLLETPGRNPALVLDRWSAFVMLFHDHDWETQLLAQALEQEALFIGAMGSRTTQVRRIEALAEAGVAAERAARVTGPIGLIPGARDPATLALSVLAQVVETYQRRA